jgi:FkbM family methyltransferase
MIAAPTGTNGRNLRTPRCQECSAVGEAELVTVNLPDGRSCQFSVEGAANRDSYHAEVAAGATFDFTWRLTNALLRPGMVFFDIGSYSVPAATKGVQVHAFELMDENIRHLSAATSANGVENVSIVHAAISDSAGTAGTLGASAWAFVDENTPGVIPRLTIDDYVANSKIEHVDVLKVDIEGSERAALNGMQRLLRRDRPDIIIESNALMCGVHNYPYRDLLFLLKDMEYRIFRIQSGWLSPWKQSHVQEVICADYYSTIKTDKEIGRNLDWPIRSPSLFEFFDSIESADRQTDVHRLYAAMIASQRPHFARWRFFSSSGNGRVCATKI